MTTTFYLGVHEPAWMERTTVPLFISHRRLARRKRLPVASGPWALDSGAFSEISAHGHFREAAGTYAAAVRRYRDEIGRLGWCAPQDWMCEPFMVERTGYSVAIHQRLTVENYLDLEEYGIPVIPVLQGYAIDDYLHCVDLYRVNGVALGGGRLVGLGSVCRRQATAEIEDLVRTLAVEGIALHGFGMKLGGLARCSDHLASADSLAWSFDARRTRPLVDCRHGVDGKGKCNNCLVYALRWREKALAVCATQQGSLRD